MRDLTDSVSRIMCVPYNEVFTQGFEDMQRRVPSIERIQHLTQWQPRYTLDDILTNVMDYERTQLPH